MISRFNNTENDWNCVRPISLIERSSEQVRLDLLACKMYHFGLLLTVTAELIQTINWRIAVAYLKKKLRKY